ncbi:MAG: aspartate-semialdehyde dehydrogenase [Burkholderiaceae bacterium]
MALKVGLVGWRGMVGSVLMQRMHEEQDFSHFNPVFFSTSNAGGKAPFGDEPLADAGDLKALSAMDIVLTCQGGDYTKAINGALRDAGWKGYWLDAASTLRMADDSVVVLDPLNRHVIDQALSGGTRDFIGGNCTVSLMMLALHGLLADNLVQWATCMTYQAASGGGAQQMRELLSQMGALNGSVAEMLADPASPILDIDKAVIDTMRSSAFPTEQTAVPLAGSLIPWIDTDLGNGMSREEWKADAECNKILGNSAEQHFPIESLCVRIGAMRCHSQALTIKLKETLSAAEVQQRLAAGNEWVSFVSNERNSSMHHLTPSAVTGTLKIAVGRVRALAVEPGIYSLFTVGDQLLWGAAEPLRRMLRILVTR